MYDFIKGKVLDIEQTKITLENQGIGYKIFVPFNLHTKLTVETTYLFYVSWIIKEDSQSLYGFLTKKERNFFEMLLNISGVGPKTAISLLGYIDLEDLQMAFYQGNVRLISSIPGIGKKTSERLIVEMKDKIKSFDKTDWQSTRKNEIASPSSDAISALIHLGYAPIQAQKAVKTVLKELPDCETSKLITLSLQKI